MNAEQANATDAELNARTEDPVVRAATVAVIQYLRASLTGGPQMRMHPGSVANVSLVVSALIHEGYTIAEKPWESCTCDAFCDSPCPRHATPEDIKAWDGGIGDLAEEMAQGKRFRAREVMLATINAPGFVGARIGDQLERLCSALEQAGILCIHGDVRALHASDREVAGTVVYVKTAGPVTEDDATQARREHAHDLIRAVLEKTAIQRGDSVFWESDAAAKCAVYELRKFGLL